MSVDSSGSSPLTRGAILNRGDGTTPPPSSGCAGHARHFNERVSRIVYVAGPRGLQVVVGERATRHEAALMRSPASRRFSLMSARAYGQPKSPASQLRGVGVGPGVVPKCPNCLGQRIYPKVVTACLVQPRRACCLRPQVRWSPRLGVVSPAHIETEKACCWRLPPPARGVHASSSGTSHG